MGKGGDVLHTVLDLGREVGKIVFEVKKTKDWQAAYLRQTKTAMESHSTRYGVLVSQVLPARRKGLFVSGGVIVTVPALASQIVAVLREGMIAIGRLRISEQGKTAKTNALFEYLRGEEFSTAIGRVQERVVELRSLATLEPATTAARIDRLDRQRAANVRASIGPGYALADRLEALRGAVGELGMPPAYTVRVMGRGRELERTFGEFLIAFALSIVFMYMILASNYESVSHPFTILLSLPLSVPFALLSLWLVGGTLNLYSALGILVLFGVVKKNAILQIDHMNHLRAQGMARMDAVIQGNRDRLRPILMTTLALVAGMLPLALGTGPGAEERRAVAIVVIGGQSLCLILTLLATPVAYSLFDDAAAWLRRRKPSDAGSAGPAPSAVAEMRRGE